MVLKRIDSGYQKDLQKGFMTALFHKIVDFVLVLAEVVVGIVRVAVSCFQKVALTLRIVVVLLDSVLTIKSFVVAADCLMSSLIVVADFVVPIMIVQVMHAPFPDYG